VTGPIATAQLDDICFGPGDVVEIATTRGFAYLQVTHLHHAYPEIVRALPGLHEIRPDSFDLLVNLPTRFTVITPLAAGLSHGHLTGGMIGRFPIPRSDQDFPIFRTPIRDRKGQVVYWWSWDGDSLCHVDCGTQSENYPIREVVHPEGLQARLAEQL